MPDLDEPDVIGGGRNRRPRHGRLAGSLEPRRWTLPAALLVAVLAVVVVHNRTVPPAPPTPVPSTTARPTFPPPKPHPALHDRVHDRILLGGDAISEYDAATGRFTTLRELLSATGPSFAATDLVSTTGAVIAFASPDCNSCDVAPRGEVLSVDPRSGAVRQIATAQGIAPAVAASGVWLVSGAGNPSGASTEITLVDPSGAVEDRIPIGPHQLVRGTANGLLAEQMDAPTLQLLDIATGRPLIGVNGTAQSAYAPLLAASDDAAAWAQPDGGCQARCVYVSGYDGASPVQVSLPAGLRAYGKPAGCAFSPDGSRLALVVAHLDAARETDGIEAVVVDLRDGTVEVVPNTLISDGDGGDTTQLVAWSTGGDAVWVYESDVAVADAPALLGYWPMHGPLQVRDIPDREAHAMVVAPW
ncbi:MAG: hypothetical protein ACR2FF_09260 [Mycobacteriales bacterium]|nr:MAG: hypothetical protein DLM56_00615 [Pseudonocardiales bacterium]